MAAPLESSEPGASKGETQKVKKARMLVSMLGADFAKSSAHPFFRDLAQTAIRPVVGKKLSEPEMSRALEKLVKHLAEPRGRAPKDRRGAQDISLAQSEPPEPAPSPETSFLKQHPVLIAKHLLTLPAQERISVLRSLPGRTARMVAAYSAELKKGA